jgi:hypothetical protein
MSDVSCSANREGVYKRWPSLKKQFTRYREVSAVHEQDVLKTLRYYVRTGEKLPVAAPGVDIPVWCSLRSTILFRGTMIVEEGQIRSLDEGVFKTDFCLGFRYAWFAILADLYLHDGFSLRFPGRSLHTMGLGTVMWAALGFALGCKSTAERLLLLLLESLKRDYFFDRDHYPIFHFILRLFADWKALELKGLPEAARHESVLDALLKCWRAPDSTDLIPCLLAACDYHTHRCRTNTAKDFFEFDDGLFTHFPAEILMLYRLREYEGLENPKVDHPLMNTPLGKLPTPISCEPDDLLSGVLERASSQGFDEDAIVLSLLGE